MKLSIYTHLFVRDGKHYLYNAQSNFLSVISKTMYDALCDREWHVLPDEVIDELRKREVVIEEGHEYDHFYSEWLKFNERNFDASQLNLVLAPTTGCNFDCPYCFEPKNNPKTITDSIIEDMAKFVKSHTNAKSLHITWYGGEPLLAFPQMKKIYEALSQKDMPEIASQTIITNGYLFTDEVIEFFKKTGLKSIQITLDGVADRHNRTRALKGSNGPTFDTIVGNIEKIACELTETNVNIRVNVNKTNYKDFIEVDRLIKTKFPDSKRINAYPGIIREETSDKLSLCQNSFQSKELNDLYRTYTKLGVEMPIFPRRPYRGCMMQASNSYIIGPEGELYKCWNDVSDLTKAIGYINQAEMTNSALYVNYMMHTSPFVEECKHCSVFPLCDGGCGHFRYRNVFEKGRYDLCSPLKDPHKLQEALLSGEISNQDKAES